MPKKILAIDDEKHILRLVEVNLKRAGYEVITASSGREAQEKVDHERPDMVVLDAEMASGDALEFLRKLKENPETREIPVITLGRKPM